MSKKDVYLFVTRTEFDILCEMRLDNVRQKLYNVVLGVRETESNHNELAKQLDDIMLEISRVKLDMEEITRRSAK